MFPESASGLGQNHGARRNSGARHSSKNFAKSLPRAALNPAPGGRLGPQGQQIVRFRDTREGVPESEAVAASWYRKAGRPPPRRRGRSVGSGVQLVYLYRDGRLAEDPVQAYM